MKHEAVESSNIKEVGFENGVLEVRFTTSGLYRYTGVTEEIHKELMAAESKGKFFGQHIRNKFPATKVEEPKPEEVTA